MLDFALRMSRGEEGGGATERCNLEDRCLWRACGEEILIGGFHFMLQMCDSLPETRMQIRSCQSLL